MQIWFQNQGLGMDFKTLIEWECYKNQSNVSSSTPQTSQWESLCDFINIQDVKWFKNFYISLHRISLLRGLNTHQLK